MGLLTRRVEFPEPPEPGASAFDAMLYRRRMESAHVRTADLWAGRSAAFVSLALVLSLVLAVVAPSAVAVIGLPLAVVAAGMTVASLWHVVAAAVWRMR